MSHDLAARFALERGYLLGEVAAGDPGTGPVGGRQGLGEDDLGQVVHERGVVAGRGRPVPGHLLVGDAAHDVGSHLAQRCDLPCADARMLGRKPPVTFAARPGNVPVQRDTHLQDHWSHENSSLSVTLFCPLQTRPDRAYVPMAGGRTPCYPDPPPRSVPAVPARGPRAAPVRQAWSAASRTSNTRGHNLTAWTSIPGCCATSPPSPPKETSPARRSGCSCHSRR